jgi:hypothetical protein
MLTVDLPPMRVHHDKDARHELRRAAPPSLIRSDTLRKTEKLQFACVARSLVRADWQRALSTSELASAV